MPLHLLGKKSWNVYNADNVARVRRDEALAAAAEEAAEQRMQENDALRRTALLRGETPPPLLVLDPADSKDADSHREARRERDPDRHRTKRRRGEDDTDRDIRLARQARVDGEGITARLRPDHDKREGRVSEVSLTDARGNIQLFSPAESVPPSKPKTRPDDKEEGVALRDAAGYGNRGANPWYTSQSDTPAIGRDAFGREDAGRSGRDAVRIARSDPLAAMRGAQIALQAARAERRREEESRRETKQERRAEARRGKDGLEGFSLDGNGNGRASEHRGHRDRAHRSRYEGRVREKDKVMHREDKDRHRDGHWRRSRSPRRERHSDRRRDRS